MDSGILLSDLCRVCNSRPPKYCCPRCHTRTCSLACCKRHKVWSSCNGKRDPAAKISKQQLATPAAFDHDYNFLSGLERVLDRTGRASKEQEQRENAGGSAFRSSKVQDYATRVGLEIVRAPKGLSRQRANETRWMGGKDGEQRGIRWTVEWVMPNGDKTTVQCMEHVPLGKLYDDIQTKRLDSSGQARKRKRKDSSHDQGKESSPQPTDRTSANGQEDAEAEVPEEVQQAETDGLAPAAPEEDTEKAVTALHLYLVKPLSSSPHTILIPFDSSTTLHSLLEHKTILEYPTIQVLAEQEDSMPPGFQTEAEYKKEHQKLIQEIEEEWGMDAPVASRPKLKSQEEMFNDSKVLESLRRDVGDV